MIHYGDPKFLYVHIPKCAGTSIRDTLRRLFPEMGQPPFPWHMTAWESLDPGLQRDRYFLFAFTRHPLARLRSAYLFASRVQKTSPSEEEFYRYLTDESRGAVPPRGRDSMSQFLCDESGRLLVDFVGRVENLAEDWRTVCQALGIPPLDLPHKNRNPDDQVAGRLLSDRCRAVIFERYREDFRRFYPDGDHF